MAEDARITEAAETAAANVANEAAAAAVGVAEVAANTATRTEDEVAELRNRIADLETSLREQTATMGREISETLRAEIAALKGELAEWRESQITVESLEEIPPEVVEQSVSSPETITKPSLLHRIFLTER